MKIPDWWEAALLAAAAWRIFWLLSEDDLTIPLRKRVPRRIYEWYTCPYCLGFWITLAWWGAWEVWPHGALVVATPFALHAGMLAAYKLFASE